MDGSDAPVDRPEIARLETSAHARLSPLSPALVRVVWVIWAVLALSLAFTSIRATFEQFSALTPAALPSGWSADDVRGSMADLNLPLGFLATYRLALDLAFVLVYFAIAAVIIWHASNERMALFAGLFLMTFGASWITDVNRMPATWRVGLLLLEWLSWTLFLFFFFLFPDGRFVPRWTRVLAIGWVLVGLGEFVLEWVGSPMPQTADLIGFSGILGAAAFAQIYRYRRVSSPAQRQQTKWIVVGFTATFLAFLGLMLLQAFFPVLGEPGRAGMLFQFTGETLGLILFLPIPLSIAIAMLRYRLWDIDLLINRALVYALLTGALVAVYLGGVVLVQSIVRALTGQETEFAIVVVTLAVAALFQPLRARLQAFIDRRFFRSRYDAARVLTAFSAALRDDATFERVSDDLLRAVRETMQPAHASLWVRPTEKQR